MSDDVDYSAGKRYAVWKSEENTLTDKGEDPLLVKDSNVARDAHDESSKEQRINEPPPDDEEHQRYDKEEDEENASSNLSSHSDDSKKDENIETNESIDVPSTAVVHKQYVPIGKIVLLFVVCSLLCSFFSVGLYRYFETSKNVQTTDDISQVVPIEGVQIRSPISDAIAEVSPCVVNILKERKSDGILANQSGSAGTGVIVASDNNDLFIITSYHVVEEFENIFLTFYDNTNTEAVLRAINEKADIALLTTPISSMQRGTQARTAAFGNSDDLVVGQTVFAIGNSLGFGFTSSSGIISALDRSVTLKNRNSGSTFSIPCLQTDTPINPGNSGGPLFNEMGEVIGIVESKYADLEVEGIAYAIPVNYIYPSIMEMVKKVQSGDLGGSIED